MRSDICGNKARGKLVTNFCISCTYQKATKGGGKSPKIVKTSGHIVSS